MDIEKIKWGIMKCICTQYLALYQNDFLFMFHFFFFQGIQFREMIPGTHDMFVPQDVCFWPIDLYYDAYDWP